VTLEVVRLTDARRRELFAEAQPVVRKIVNLYGAKWPNLVRKARLSVEDLVAIGDLELWQSSSAFKEGPGRKLETYAWKAVNGAIKNAVKAETRHERAVSEGMARGADQGTEEPPQRRRYEETSAETRDAAVHAFSDTVVAAMLMSLAAADPEREVMSAQLHDRLNRAVDELSAKDGRLIRRHYFEDWTLEAAGAELGMSRSTVKRRHQKILERLGARLLALGVTSP
jgi:RNA polymerase sigma factor for flagellar operon FliA